MNTCLPEGNVRQRSADLFSESTFSLNNTPHSPLTHSGFDWPAGWLFSKEEISPLDRMDTPTAISVTSRYWQSEMREKQS